MAPTPFTVDYYAVLGVAVAADQVTIKRAFRRLALLKHPDKNGNSQKATADFQKLTDAYSTLSDPNLRERFDRSYPSIRKTHFARTSEPSSQTHNVYGTSQSRPAQSSPQTSEEPERERKIVQLEKEISQLGAQRRKLEGDKFELQRDIKRKNSTLSRIKLETAEEAKEDAYKKTWFGYFFQPCLSAAEQEARNRRASGRRTGQLVVEADLDRHEVEMTIIQSQLDMLDRSIRGKQIEQTFARKQQEAHAEQRARADELQKQEAARIEREERLKRAREAESRRQEEEFSKARAERTRREEREMAEARRACFERQCQHERDRKQREFGKPEPGKQRQRGQRAEDSVHGNGSCTSGTSRTKDATSKTTCKHRGWWQRVDGRSLCQSCGLLQRKFTFCCPGCQVMACASCRRKLKG